LQAAYVKQMLVDKINTILSQTYYLYKYFPHSSIIFALKPG